MKNIKYYERYFDKHIASLADCGNLKVLDFKAPDTNEYRIRFVFEEEYYRLHISGDLGELTASNYYNMTYEGFNDFVNDAGYFESKIDCHSRPLYSYDTADAEADLKELLSEPDMRDAVLASSPFVDADVIIENTISDILENYEDGSGLNAAGIKVLCEFMSEYDAYDFASTLGKRRTQILDIYLLAYKLARKQLEGKEETSSTKEETSSTAVVKPEDRCEFIGQLIDCVEDFLSSKGVSFPETLQLMIEAGCSEEEIADNDVVLYGENYDRLAEPLEAVCRGWGIID